MKRSKIRIGLAIVVTMLLGVLAWIELRESFGPDTSSDAQIRQLDSYWNSRRKEAAVRLGQFPTEAEKVVPPLVKALGDADRDVRCSALDSLRNYGARAKPAGTVVAEMLKNDSDAEIRQRAAAVLGVIKEEATVPVLFDALDDFSPAVRLEATRSLGWFDPQIATAPLVDKVMSGLSSDHPVELRNASVETLHALAKDQERVARAIADCAGNDPSPRVRFRAVAVMKKPAFPFQVPAMIAALEDPDPQVRMTASANLAAIGMADMRAISALCTALVNADDQSRDGLGANVDLIVLARQGEKITPEELNRKYQAAAREFAAVLGDKHAAGRHQIISLFARFIVNYQATGLPALLEPARAAAAAMLARAEDESEADSLRLHAMNQWKLISLGPSRTGTSRTAAHAPKDELHATALWIRALARLLVSKAPDVRFRAGLILTDGIRDTFTDTAIPLAWRKEAIKDTAIPDAWQSVVPTLAESAQVDDDNVRILALSLLGRLGPVARPALPTLNRLAHDSPDPAARSAALDAIKSINAVDGLKAKDPSARITAAKTLGALGWPVRSELPALAGALEDPAASVRRAVAQALEALGLLSEPAVPSLAKAFAGEKDAGVRAAIVVALEAISPGVPAVIDAHLKALRDPDRSVRKAGAAFQRVPADDAAVTAFGAVLGDESEEVRTLAAKNLTSILFENSNVVPVLLKALGDDSQRETVIAALEDRLENTSDAAEFNRVRGNVPKLRADLGTIIPALSQALSLKGDGVRPLVFGLLGRIVAFGRISRDAELRKAVQPALQAYLAGLEDSDLEIREDVLGNLENIPIQREEIVAALNKFLERPDLPAEDRETALGALKAQTAAADADAK